MSLEKQILNEQHDIRKEALIRRVAHLLEGTIQLEGMTPETNVEDVRARMTTDSVRIIATLVEAVDILEAIIWASDGCVGHKHCAHSMEPWQRARALLRGKWDAYENRTDWPTIDSGTE